MATGENEVYRWHGPVPRVETDEDLRALRALLEGYTEPAICARLNLPNLQAYTAPSEPERAAAPIECRLDALIRLFLDCLYVPEDALAPETVALLDRLGLIARAAARPGAIYAAAAILTVAGECTICDRGNAPDGSRCPLPPDVVYPAIFENTRRFLASLPTTPCDALLDLGTGTGIAALAGARHSRRVWATDITARAVAFANLNCRLAGLENITVAEGDLYHPVEGLTFDRIVIHPPYVPARRSKFVFRDAGEDGSAIIRGAVAGLPQFLRPGGRFYAILLAFDREGETFEQRVRGWLGPSQAEFDVAVAAYNIQSPSEFLAQYLSKGPTDDDDVRFWTAMWQATRTQAVLYASLVIGRHAAPRESITRRVRIGAGYHASRLEALLDWEAAGGGESVERLLDSRPKASAQCVFRTASRIHQGQFVIESMALETAGPFRSAMNCEWWLAQVLARCDGAQSWRELYQWVRQGDLIPETVTAAEFAGLLGVLVRNGLVECESLAHPDPLVQ